MTRKTLDRLVEIAIQDGGETTKAQPKKARGKKAKPSQGRADGSAGGGYSDRRQGNNMKTADIPGGAIERAET